MSGAWTKGVVVALRRLGYDVDALSDSIGVDVDVFLDVTGRPPRDASGRLWRAALAQSGDRFLGLSAAEVWEARVDHLVYLLLVSADTFGDGLLAAVRFQELLAHGRVITVGEAQGEYVPVYVNKVEHELTVLSHEIEFVAAMLVKLFRFATGDFQLFEVHFEHPYRGNMEKYTEAFRAPVRFGQPRSALLITRATWDAQLSNANHSLHAQLGQIAAAQHAQLHDGSFLDSVRERIRGLIPNGNCAIDAVAASLHVTPRTLQRRLQEEGTTFRALVDASRKSIVLDCVERQQPTDEIIRHAGYTNSRSFRRAMKRWKL